MKIRSSHFSNDVKIEGKDLKAGTYGLFLGYAKDGPSTWIFSNNSTSWGSYFYNESEDALRVNTTPQDGAYTEYLTFGFDERKPNSAIAFVQWENKKVPFKIEVPNVNDIYVTQMRNSLRSSTGFDTRNFSTAAQFCAQNKINLEEALVWANNGADPAMGGVADFNSLSTKANVLKALNREAEASTIMDQAIKVPNTPHSLAYEVFYLPPDYRKTALHAGKKLLLLIVQRPWPLMIKKREQKFWLRLKAEEHILSAAIYDAKGGLFSRYPADISDRSLPEKPQASGYHYEQGNLVGFEPVVLADRNLGTLYIMSDMEAIYDRLKLYGAIALLVVGVTFFVAYLLSKTAAGWNLKADTCAG
ncbi:MAG: DUF2911 domain-containing protein [Bacteroidota bacterium]